MRKFYSGWYQFRNLGLYTDLRTQKALNRPYKFRSHFNLATALGIKRGRALKKRWWDQPDWLKRLKSTSGSTE